MSEHQEYFEYLKKRSFLGFIYRQYFLYPKISNYLQGKTLDIGCGIGDFLSYRNNTIGVDINKETVNWCRDKGLEAFIMNEDKIPFEDNTFDSVIMDNVLEHISEPKPLMEEIIRVMKKNGKLMIGVPGEVGYSVDDDHKVFYTRESLKKLLGEYEFKEEVFFETPSKFKAFKRMRQHCLYSTFSLKN